MPDTRGHEEWDWKNTALAIAIGVFVYLVLGLFLWLLLSSYIDPSAIKDPAKEATAKKDLVQVLGLIMAGVAGAVGVIFTWRNLQQGQANLRLTQEGMEQTQEGTQESLRLTQEQLKLSREDHQLTRQGQITERFTRAIELLGASSDGGQVMEARVGAVYTLEGIAKESDEYYWPSMEILASYVRHNAVRKSGEAEEENSIFEFRIGHERADIQAIISVLGRRAGRFPEEEDKRIVLHETDLRNAYFHDGNFTGLWLLRADLRGASFGGADLRNAYLGHSDLRRALLTDAENLTNASFQEADLKGTRLQGADLTGVRDLTQAQIEQAFGDEHTILPNGLTKPAHWTANDTRNDGDEHSS